MEAGCFYKAVADGDYGGNKYEMGIRLVKIGREVIMGLAMDDEEIMKIGRGDSV